MELATAWTASSMLTCVYPPKKMRALAACVPTTAIFFTPFASGNTPLFFKSTMDSNADCFVIFMSSLPTKSSRNASPSSANGCSKSPMRNFARNTRSTARSSTSMSARPSANHAFNSSLYASRLGSSTSTPASMLIFPASSNVSLACWALYTLATEL